MKRKISRALHETNLLKRAHEIPRWENSPAYRGGLKNLDREEILRTREAAIRQRRLPAGTSKDVGEILDRLGLRIHGKITHAAQVLYGKNLFTDYLQCHIKMGRFKGMKITGDLLENKQEFLNAFATLREAMAFLDRTLSGSARPIPAEALREIILNAIIHRDYSKPWGYIAVAVYDDRIEIISIGTLPTGITAESLSGLHTSKLRNPLIAETFHRIGAVREWGRGTNRVIEACKHYGIEPPTFSESEEAVTVTFRVPTTPDAGARSGIGL